jgi:hypothetical protein
VEVGVEKEQVRGVDPTVVEEEVARCQGRRGGGAGARRGPTNGRGGGQCGVEVPVEEERAHGVDLAAVREVVGEVPTLTRRRWRHGAGRGGGVGMRVAGKMIVARVRV